VSSVDLSFLEGVEVDAEHARLTAVAPCKMIIHKQQIKLASASCFVAVAPNHGLGSPVSWGGTD